MKSSVQYTGIKKTVTFEGDEIGQYFQIMATIKEVATNFTSLPAGVELPSADVVELVGQQVNEVGGVVEVLGLMEKSGIKASGVTRPITMLDQEISYFHEALVSFSQIMTADFNGQLEKPSGDTLELYNALWSASVEDIKKVAANL